MVSIYTIYPSKLSNILLVTLYTIYPGKLYIYPSTISILLICINKIGVVRLSVQRWLDFFLFHYGLIRFGTHGYYPKNRHFAEWPLSGPGRPLFFVLEGLYLQSVSVAL